MAIAARASVATRSKGRTSRSASREYEETSAETSTEVRQERGDAEPDDADRQFERPVCARGRDPGRAAYRRSAHAPTR